MAILTRPVGARITFIHLKGIKQHSNLQTLESIKKFKSEWTRQILLYQQRIFRVVFKNYILILGKRMTDY